MYCEMESVEVLHINVSLLPTQFAGKKNVELF